MPTDLIHRICIATATETVYRAITTEDGITAWWMTLPSKIAHGFSRGLARGEISKSRQGRKNFSVVPLGLFILSNANPALKSWAVFGSAVGATSL